MLVSVDYLKAALDAARSENASLQRRIRARNLLLPFLFSALLAFVGFFVKVGIPVVSDQWFSQRKELAARIVLYTFVLCIVFPILACVISNSVNNERVLRALEMSSQQNSSRGEETGNAVQRWWKNFTSPENLATNLCYYSISFFVACFLCFIQYIAIIGINELFSPMEHHRLETIVGISIVAGIAVAILGIIFSSALQNLLYHRHAEPLPSSCFCMEKVAATEMSEGNRAQ